MARAAEKGRLLAVELYLACGQVQLCVLRVLHGDAEVYGHAAHGVHDLLHAVHVDLGVVGYLDARKLLHRLYGERRPAERVRGVDLLRAVLAHVDPEVARDRYERGLLLLRVDADQHDGVGAVRPLARAVLASLRAGFVLVHAKQQHVERLARLLLGKRAQKRAVDVLAQAGVDVAQVGRAKAGCRHNDRKHAHEHRLHDAVRAALAAGLRVVSARGAAGKPARVANEVLVAHVLARHVVSFRQSCARGCIQPTNITCENMPPYEVHKALPAPRARPRSRARGLLVRPRAPRRRRCARMSVLLARTRCRASTARAVVA